MKESSANVPASVRIGRAIVPGPFRPAAGRLLVAAGRQGRNLHWSLLSPQRRRRVVDRRLHLRDSSWLFVVGVTNSGTTLLSRLLERHPGICGLPKEGQYLTDALPRPDDSGHGRMWAVHPGLYRWTEHDDPAPALRCMYDWSWHYMDAPGILLEKSPPNLLRMRWLQANFAPVRFIVITRNPYAVCEGICRRRRDYTIEQAAEQWRRAHEFFLEDRAHIERSVHITYERLCDATLDVLHELEPFLGLDEPFDRAMLAREFDIHNVHGTPASLQNFNERSLERLSAADMETVTRVAGDVMQRIGYEPIRAPR